MSGLNGSAVTGLLDERHAHGCDGQEFTKLSVAPYGPGFVVVRLVWCGECGASEYEYVDKMLPEPGEFEGRWP